MQNKTIAIVSIVAIIVTFALGRYSATSSTTTLDETSKTDTQINADVNTHTSTHSVTEQHPDGTTTITTDTDTTKEATKSTTKDNTTAIDQTVVQNKRSAINVSLLAAYDGHNPGTPIVYGASVSKEVLGPITIGLFGLTSGTVGMSVGVNF